MKTRQETNVTSSMSYVEMPATKRTFKKTSLVKKSEKYELQKILSDIKSKVEKND